MEPSELIGLPNIKIILNSFTERTKRPLCIIDFEFNNSQERNLNLVSCSLLTNTTVEGDIQPFTVLELWLLGGKKKCEELTDILTDLKNQKTVMLAYGASSEARCFQALGLDPHDFTWIDEYVEWRQLTFNNNSCQYGTYFTPTGYKRRSTPPSFNKERNQGRDNNTVKYGLVACVGQMFEVFIDSIYKKQMRDLILENKPHYTAEEKKQIMSYCTMDIMYLPAILEEQTKRLMVATGLNIDQIFKIQARRGQFMASIAKMETEGIPINRSKVEALRHNFESTENKIITDLVENHYPFYKRERKTLRDLRGSWVDKYDMFIDFVKAKGLYDKWPRSINVDTKKPTDTLSRKNEILKQYDGVPEIYAYRQAKKSIKQLAWFKKPNEKQLKDDGDFFESVGTDSAVRTFLGAYGTQTSRNAPKAKRFILAMSAWLRCLIQAPKGWAVIALDYASQEFAIASVLSKDPSMIEAYRSGDPYLYFAKKAGAVPESADPKLCKKPKLAPPELKENYMEYKRQRGLFKATTLGLQYGMGFKNLAIKLSSDTGEIITEGEAKKLIRLHQRIYPIYWSWLDKQEREYKRNKVLFLWDGWALLGDNSNMLSVKNFPTQGTGGVIMREAVRLAHQQGIKILAPLHDAIYAKCKIEDIKETSKALEDCMIQAFYNVIGEMLVIRVDIDVHKHDEEWIDEKGEDFYYLLKEYLVKTKNSNDKLEELKSTIYSRALS